jgi:phenylalanyl-tRNA synthetase beta chain
MRALDDVLGFSLRTQFERAVEDRKNDMKISLKWINEYIDILDQMAKPQELVAKLTAAGLEVESVQNLSQQFQNVVVGAVIEKGKHPNADRLSLCQISTGDGVVHQIVCGAQNHSQGDRVVVALPGAVLPGDFKIQHSKIRGVESGGMLCSEKELGLKETSEGILLLPKDAPVGTPFAKYKGLDDIIFDIKVTPNRADCLSHFGVARELSCLLGRELKKSEQSFGSTVGLASSGDGASSGTGHESRAEAGNASDGTSKLKVDILANDMCLRYAAQVMKQVKVGPSPDWLKGRIETVGMKSINNVVDATNFVMMELGQPMHAFDLKEIRGSEIKVAKSVAGETFTTLDGTDLKLDGTELTIRDSERALALAGVVGGKNSGISEGTTEIVLEAAYFVPSDVRRTARRLGLETDSSYRFSRGVNPEATIVALQRCAELIADVADGVRVGDFIDIYPKAIQRASVDVTQELMEDRLGYKVIWPDVVSVLRRLGCQVLNETSDSVKVAPPMFRVDIQIDMDLVEEYARLHGYEHIPETLPKATGLPLKHDPLFKIEAKSRETLQSYAHQAVNFGFLHSKYQDKLVGDINRWMLAGLKMQRPAVHVLNPISDELDAMRLSLLPGLLTNTVQNLRAGNMSGRLFEFGAVQLSQKQPNDDAPKNSSKSQSSSVSDGGMKYTEEQRLGFSFWGAPLNLWTQLTADKYQSNTLFSLKATIDIWLRSVGVKSWRWVEFQAANEVPEILHPSQASRLEIGGVSVGMIGSLHPLLKDEYKIRDAVAVAELSFEKIVLGQNVQQTKFSPISKFPAMDRDLAFVMAKAMPAGRVEEVIRKTAGANLQSVDIFDLFSGASLPEGMKSVAYRLVFQDLTKTLEDTHINSVRDAIVNAVTSELGVQFRG